MRIRIEYIPDMDSGNLIPVEMRGLSMAPWLMPRDVLLLNVRVPISSLRLGDVVILKNGINAERIAHRIVGLPLATKGDRSPEKDELGDEWGYEGLVVRRCRNGAWKTLGWRRALWFLCRFNLYPDQRHET